MNGKELKIRPTVSDRVFAVGMHRLMLAFPYPALSPQDTTARAKLYRQMLGGLSDEQWIGAVTQALNNEKSNQFPTIAKLLDYASIVAGARQSENEMPDPRTIEERRECARRGLEMIKEAIKRIGGANVSNERSTAKDGR